MRELRYDEERVASVPEDERPVCGIQIRDAFGGPATEEDFIRACDTLKALTGVQYLARGSGGAVEYTGPAKLLFEAVERRGWSRERFRAALTHFTEHHKYRDKWQPADVLEIDTGTLFPWSWVEREQHRNPSAQARMEGYAIPIEYDGNGTATKFRNMYRYKSSGPTLPFERIFYGKE